MEFISKIVEPDANIDLAAIWITKNSFLANVNGLCKQIVEDYKPTGWSFWIHLKNGIDFGALCSLMELGKCVCCS